MEGISLGSAYLRLYGDRSALDRELEKLRRYTDQLEKQGIKVQFDADTGKASREINGLQNRLSQLQKAMGQVSAGVRGDTDAWKGLADNIAGLAGKASQTGGAMGKMAGMLGTAGSAAATAIPILGQLGMAAMGVKAIFEGLSTAISGVLSPLMALSHEAGRFNKQVAEASIFAANSFAVFGPDGKAIQGTANQMRALRGTISKEFQEIHKEVAQISGATASEIFDGFNIILQNVGALGEAGQDLENVRKLSTRLAAGMNTLNIPGQQLRSEMSSLLTGDVQIYDKLGRDLYGPNASQTIKRLQSEGKFYDDLMGKLEKLYDGQKVLSESLENVQSNFQDVFETINAEGGQALERGLAKGLKAVLNPLDQLQRTFAKFARGVNELLEPVLRILGEIGGWFVSVGSAIASTLQVVFDVLALAANAIGAVLGPQLRTVGKVLTLIAKGFELVAATVSTVLRPITTFFRILGDQDNQGVDDFFDPIIDGLDQLITYTERAAELIAKPFIELAKWRAWARGKLMGKSEDQIRGEQDEIEVAFGDSVGRGASPSLRSLKLSKETEALLNEIGSRYGSGSQRQLQNAKETAQLVQDRLKNEITGMEQVLKLMQAQKGLQESMNQLADARRGLAMSRASFSVQVAGSPEARLEAEERRNQLAAEQEQQRISERRALLGTERQMLQVQLQIQMRQQQIQQEQLKIQRAEIQIQRDKAVTAAKDVATRLNNAPAGSREYAALREQWSQLGREIQLREQQLQIMGRTVSLAFEAESGLRRTNALEEQRLGIQGQVLDVQGQSANLTLEQQQTLSRLQRQEQELKNQLADQVRPRNDLIKKAEEELRILQGQEKAQKELQELEKARLETRKASADAEVQAAERQLRAVQARDGGGSFRDYLAAEIEAIAAGVKGYVSEADAVKRLYDAKDRQLAVEQTMQREQLRIQQERELSERRIASLQLTIEEQKTLNLQSELQIRRQQLGLQQQRDAISGTQAPQAGTLPGAPSAPVLPAPAGGGARGGTLSVGALKGLAMAAGFNERDASIMAAIAMAESSGRYGALNDNPRTGDLSYGLWQINMIDRLGPERRRRFGIPRNESLFHPEINSIAARQVYESQGFNAWSVYRSGAYRQYLPGAMQAQPVAASQTVGATAGQAPASLQSDLLDNTRALVDVEGSLARIRKEQAELAAGDAQLLERNAEQTEALRINQQAAISQQQAERLRIQLTAELLNSLKGRFVTGIADAFSTGMIGAVRGVFASLRSGGSVTDAINTAFEQMADQAIDSILNIALQPLQQSIQAIFKDGLLGSEFQSIEQQVAAQQQGAAQGLQTAGQGLQAAGQSLQAAAQALTSAATGGIPGQAAASAPDTPADPAAAGAAGVAAAGAAAKETSEKAKEFQKAMGAATQAFAGVALAITGIEQLSRGGTYNVLMGLASIFGSIGSFASLFGGFRATGGETLSGKAYVVGEEGPELFFPGINGQIISNPQSRAMVANAADPWAANRQTFAATAFAATRAAVEEQEQFAVTRAIVSGQQDSGWAENAKALADALSNPSEPLRVAFETTRINNVDYVTADQFRRGMTDAAERGRALTLSSLKNSVKTRRSVGF